MAYRVFTRSWWKRDPAWPGGRRPAPGRKTTRAIVATEAEARDWCQVYNATHPEGRTGIKAEYERA